MKDVTLKEFIEIAKDNEELKNSVAECVKTSKSGQLSDDLLNIAAGAGYNLTSSDIRDFVPFRGGKVLNDETVGSVAGGVSQETEKGPEYNPGGGSDNVLNIDTKTLEPKMESNSLCRVLCEYFGIDPSLCP